MRRTIKPIIPKNYLMTNKNNILVALLICANTLIINALSAQSPAPNPKTLALINSDSIYAHPEDNAEFSNGQTMMFKYLGDHIQYPVLAREQGAEGKAIITFVVNKDGSIQDIKLKRFDVETYTTSKRKKKAIIITREAYKELGKEAIRVVGSMPNWRPARINGTAVRSSFTLPIKFMLD